MFAQPSFPATLLEYCCVVLAGLAGVGPRPVESRREAGEAGSSGGEARCFVAPSIVRPSSMPRPCPRLLSLSRAWMTSAPIQRRSIYVCSCYLACCLQGRCLFCSSSYDTQHLTRPF